jgi:hypothetical protein
MKWKHIVRAKFLLYGGPYYTGGQSCSASLAPLKTFEMGVVWAKIYFGR